MDIRPVFEKIEQDRLNDLSKNKEILKGVVPFKEYKRIFRSLLQSNPSIENLEFWIANFPTFRVLTREGLIKTPKYWNESFEKSEPKLPFKIKEECPHRHYLWSKFNFFQRWVKEGGEFDIREEDLISLVPSLQIKFLDLFEELGYLPIILRSYKQIILQTSRLGRIENLEWLVSRCPKFSQTFLRKVLVQTSIQTSLSRTSNRAGILNWWKINFSIESSTKFIPILCKNYEKCKMEILEWWESSGLLENTKMEFYFGKRTLEKMQIAIWFEKFGVRSTWLKEKDGKDLPIILKCVQKGIMKKINKRDLKLFFVPHHSNCLSRLLNYAPRRLQLPPEREIISILKSISCTSMLEIWKKFCINSKFDIVYPDSILISHSENEEVELLDWWMSSGFRLEILPTTKIQALQLYLPVENRKVDPEIVERWKMFKDEQFELLRSCPSMDVLSDELVDKICSLVGNFPDF
nr:ankyrin repeat protein [Pithovirus mammoth]